MNKTIKPTKHSANILAQLCKFIPEGVTQKLAKKFGVDKKSRTFTPWSHVVSLLFTHLIHAVSLNDVCDALRNHASKLSTCRGAVPPARNTLSYANTNRDSAMMEALFWETKTHLENLSSGFAGSGKYCKLPHRFKKTIYAIDASTIQLLATCISWAKHRRQKAAAKLHLRLNLQTFLPEIAIVEEASHHDGTRAVVLCAGLKDGEIAVFDMAYVDFEHLYNLLTRGVNWVTRAKDNMSYRVHRRLLKKPQGKILRDDIIYLKVKKSRKQYPEKLRRVEAEVEVNGKIVTMAFITNNFDWAPQSVCDLYKSRWGIEVFFKQIKQTLQLCDFLGTTKESIQWQVWSALLLYLLIRYQAYLSKWTHSFTRIITLIRGVVWDRFNLLELLGLYGTAHERWRMQATPQTAFLPGFS